MMPSGTPDEKHLLDNLGKIAYTLDKTYLSRLTEDYAPLCFDETYNKEEVICFENNIRALRVDRWIFDESEKPGECFKNVLSLFADGDHTIALVVKRTPSASEMYFVVKNEGQARNEDSRNNIELLNSSLKGNFPGTHTTVIGTSEVEELFSFPSANSIAVLANTPSEYSEDYVTQGLDKLLNGIVPKDESESYAAVFLAEALTLNDIRDILSGFEEIATAIHPFLQYQFQVGSNQTDTQGEMQSISNTKSISDSVFKTHSINIGLNGSVSRSRTDSTSVNASLALKIPGFIPIVGSLLKSATIGIAKSAAQTTARALGVSAGYGYSWGTSKTVTNGTTDTTGTSSSISIGTSEDTSYTYKSYLVENLVEKLEKTMERIARSQATGLWKFSTYVLASDSKTSKNVANYLRAVTQGSESFLEPSAIQEWSREHVHGSSPFDEIRKYVTHFTHPIFVTGEPDAGSEMIVTPTAYVATDELSHVVAFPRSSMQGLPVLQCVPFGREPHSLQTIDADLELGSAYHMHEVIAAQRIRISREELTKHTFITGSTGSGKSNTIYKLLEHLAAQEVKFLVVEPAKGEYRTVFGAKDGVTVYGTNPNLPGIPMLRLNPFRFPTGVHVLEHLDRLVEIFNVCWPMYAAMPAILKDAVERAYTASGWNLMTSENRYDSRLFPTFSDVLAQIRLVLNESDYSADNKGDYTGALVTRLRSLTNGINGLIFTTDDLPDEQLFDANVIVDLSRVGSTETKSLIMGLMVLKLQEHRMERGQPNAKLRHVTVLEEAHNLLKRTSTEQTGEGANLLGKSVEMLANSIAEMRTYGEGFVIADQAPGLLDLSVIRNTNTKIILRLPDFSDRELVGRSAGLNDKQIEELGRLEQGVAAITQSGWLEPVLCKIDPYDGADQWADKREAPSSKPEAEDVERALLDCIMNRELSRKSDRVELQRMRDQVVCSRLDMAVKRDLIEYLDAEKGNRAKALRTLAFDFFHAEQAIQASRPFCGEIEKWSQQVLDSLTPSVREYPQEQTVLLLAAIVYEQAERDRFYEAMCCKFVETNRKRGLL